MIDALKNDEIIDKFGGKGGPEHPVPL